MNLKQTKKRKEKLSYFRTLDLPKNPQALSFNLMVKQNG